MKIKYILLLLPLLACAFPGRCEKIRTVGQMLQAVRDYNLGYAAEKLNIPAADADIVAARVFGDPTLSVEYGNNDDWHAHMGQSVSAELGYTLTPGKRGPRIDLAKSERALSEALLADYLRRLSLETLTAWHTAVMARQLYRLSVMAYGQLDTLAKGDSLRNAIGDMRPADALATRIQANVARGNVAMAGSDYENALQALSLLTSGSVRAADIDLGDDAVAIPEPAPLAFYLENAENRADLVAALKNTDVARKALKLTQRERNLDIDLSVGYNYNTPVTNEIAPAPRFSGLTVGVGIPLPFSNRNKGAVQAARIRVDQAAMQYQQAYAEVRNEVTQAYVSYEGCRKRLREFDTATLRNSKQIYDSYRQAYEHRDVSLSEFIAISQMHYDLMTAYYTARCEAAIAWATLTHAANMAD